ncbi:urea ABC transporter permease subunit UrtB [Mangrovicoccus ximenensis]|uniref:urea ABC transporter permease subunit UrtB n=1 Tax=Mangrovicoccus ximenensis TaxID=1911570 RepID=UPI0038B2D82D
MGNTEARTVLSGALGDADPAVAEAAAEAVRHIEQVQNLWGLAQNVWFGLSLGSVLLLAAIGLAITFGVMGVINMAHGELVMLGAYTTFAVQEVIRSSFPALFDWSLLIAAPLAFLVAGGVGVAIERGVVRFLYGRPLETLLATWGISLMLQQAVRTIFGPNNREVGNPGFMSGAFELGQMTVTWNRLWILVFALAVFAVLLFVLKKTPIGLQMRAVTQNRAMAANMGIRTGWVDAMTFGLGAGIAGLAGVALSQIDNVSPNLGQSYIVDSFMVVVFGGAGNIWGTLAGAFSLGIANKFLEPWTGAVLAKILVLVFIILFIQKRPRGLFAVRGRAVDA